MELRMGQCTQHVKAQLCGEIFTTLLLKLHDFQAFEKSILISFNPNQTVALVLTLADRRGYLDSEQNYQSQRFQVQLSGLAIVEQFLDHLAMRLVRSQNQGRLTSSIDAELLRYLSPASCLRTPSLP